MPGPPGPRSRGARTATAPCFAMEAMPAAELALTVAPSFPIRFAPLMRFIPPAATMLAPSFPTKVAPSKPINPACSWAFVKEASAPLEMKAFSRAISVAPSLPMSEPPSLPIRRLASIKDPAPVAVILPPPAATRFNDPAATRFPPPAATKLPPPAATRFPPPAATRKPLSQRTAIRASEPGGSWILIPEPVPFISRSAGSWSTGVCEQLSVTFALLDVAIPPRP